MNKKQYKRILELAATAADVANKKDLFNGSELTKYLSTPRDYYWKPCDINVSLYIPFENKSPVANIIHNWLAYIDNPRRNLNKESSICGFGRTPLEAVKRLIAKLEAL